MRKNIEGFLRIALVIYTVINYFKSGFIVNFSWENPREFGQILGNIIGMYLMLALWVNWLFQAILNLRKKKQFQSGSFDNSCIYWCDFTLWGWML